MEGQRTRQGRHYDFSERRTSLDNLRKPRLQRQFFNITYAMSQISFTLTLINK